MLAAVPVLILTDTLTFGTLAAVVLALGVLTLFADSAAQPLLPRIRVVEPPAPRRAAGRHVGHDIVDGMRFTYRHPTLRPLAISVHVWFLGNSIVMTVFAVYALRELALPAWAFGVALAAAGVGGFVGALIAPALGARWGAGRAILFGRTLVVVPGSCWGSRR